MSKISGLHFYVNDELNLVIDDCRGETVRHKVISLNTFCKLIDKTSEVKDIQTGVLPERCISYRESQKGTKYITLEMGSSYADVTYEKTKYEHFPVPRLLYGFKLDRENKITEVSVAVADRGVLRDDTKLYKYPFSNVSGFNMCIGSNAMPKIKQLRQLSGIPYYIFAMPDNNDRYTPSRTKLEMEYRTMLEFLKDKDTDFYYENVLIPSGKTLKDFINQ